jgi:stage IV sporulation protein FB
MILSSIHLDGRLCLLLALMLLLLPLQWVLAAMLAALVHELFHAAVILLLGGQIYGIHLSASGIRMEVAPMSPGREVLGALAGPLGSAVLTLFVPIAPRIALCAAVHCLFNLLPLFPLDGGRILRNLLSLYLPARWAELIFIKSQHLLRVSILALCFLASLRWGIIPAVLGFMILMRQRKARTV